MRLECDNAKWCLLLVPLWFQNPQCVDFKHIYVLARRPGPTNEHVRMSRQRFEFWHAMYARVPAITTTSSIALDRS
jgi:hypothetical protein